MFGLQQGIQTKIESDFNNNHFSIVKVNGSPAAQSVSIRVISTIIWKIYEKMQIWEHVIKYSNFPVLTGDLTGKQGRLGQNWLKQQRNDK